MTLAAAVTGLGCICAAGGNLPRVMASLYAGERHCAPPRAFAADLEIAYPVFEYCGLRIADCGLKERYEILNPKSEIRNPQSENPHSITRTSALALAATLEACAQAGLDAQNLAALRVGVCLGTTVGCTLNDEEFYRNFKEGLMPDIAPVRRYLASNPALFIKRALGLIGPAATVANACSSGTDAIGLARAWLRAGWCDAVIAGGADELSRIPYLGFAHLLITSPEPCRPFDRARRGLNLGEGAGIMILERAESAARRGAPVLAEVAGYGCASDAYHPTAPHPEGKGLRRAIAAALRDADLTPAQIGFINAHGTSTPDNDKVEGRVLGELFPPGTPVAATKAYTGHTLGAAGGIEAVLTVQALLDGRLPATAGFAEPDPACTIAPTTRNLDVDATAAISDSLAFGGNNSALVFRKDKGQREKDKGQRTKDKCGMSERSAGVSPASSSAECGARSAERSNAECGMRNAERSAGASPASSDCGLRIADCGLNTTRNEERGETTEIKISESASTMAILGIGTVSALGCGVGSLAEALHGQRQPALQTHTVETARGAVNIPVHTATPEGLDRFIPKRSLRRLDKFVRMALLASFLAAEDAALDLPGRARIGIVFGTGYGPLGTTFEFQDTIVSGGDKCASPTAFAGSVHNAPASQVAIALGLEGPCLTLTTFERTAAGVLRTAEAWLREGLADLVLAGLGDEFHPVGAYAAAQMGPAPGLDPCAGHPGEMFSAFLLGRAGERPAKYGRIAAIHALDGPDADGAAAILARHDAAILGTAGTAGRCASAQFETLLGARRPAAIYTPYYGASPAAPGMDLAAAALALRGGALPPVPATLPPGTAGNLARTARPLSGNAALACATCHEDGSCTIVSLKRNDAQ